MAIMDKKLEFFDAQDITGNSGATFAGNTLDLGPRKDWNGTNRNPDMGYGEPLYIHVRVGTAAAGHVATGTVAVFLQHGSGYATASFSNLTNLNLSGSASMTANKLTAGKVIYSAPMPTAHKRYLRCKITLGGATFTGGTIDAWLEGGSLPNSYD